MKKKCILALILGAAFMAQGCGFTEGTDAVVTVVDSTPTPEPDVYKRQQFMCTAATYKTKNFYFGRTLDYEFSYGDEITITPRNYTFEFRHMEKLSSHYAIIGMAHVAGDYPLYYDAVNEKGLGMAGLNFVGNAVYNEVENGKENVAQFEFIPWILSKCATVQEAKDLLKKIDVYKRQLYRYNG